MHYCKEKKGLFITNNAKMSRWFFDTTRRKMREKKCDDNVKIGEDPVERATFFRTIFHQKLLF